VDALQPLAPVAEQSHAAQTVSPLAMHGEVSNVQAGHDVVQAAHCVSAEGEHEAVRYSPTPHALHAAHWRSLKPPQAADCHWPLGQAPLHVAHVVSASAEHAAAVYCPEPHVAQYWYTVWFTTTTRGLGSGLGVAAGPPVGLGLAAALGSAAGLAAGLESAAGLGLAAGPPPPPPPEGTGQPAGMKIVPGCTPVMSGHALHCESTLAVALQPPDW
jgi:hypothetical protein